MCFYMMMTDEMRAMAPNQTGPHDFVSSYAPDPERAFGLPNGGSTWTHKVGPSSTDRHDEESKPFGMIGSRDRRISEELTDNLETPRGQR